VEGARRKAYRITLSVDALVVIDAKTCGNAARATDPAAGLTEPSPVTDRNGADMTQEKLRQEVTELTELMREDSDFADIRTILAAQGLPPGETLLAGLISGGDGRQCGVLVTDTGQCALFETDARGTLIRWETVDDIARLENDFGAVAVGVEMHRNGEIG
jgi:hypothetical protein